MDSTEHHIHFNDTRLKKNQREKTIIFIHRIGVGLIYYVPLINCLLELGRHMLFPKIPYITFFHTWLRPPLFLSPGSMPSTIIAMLSLHGFLNECFVGHSYGTLWLSYMCKYSLNALDNVIFLDPICFSLHMFFNHKAVCVSKSGSWIGQQLCTYRHDNQLDNTTRISLRKNLALFGQHPTRRQAFCALKQRTR